MALSPNSNAPVQEVAGERDRFIDKAIDGYLDSRTGTLRNVSVDAYVSSELSQNNRRPLTDQERSACEAASADKLRRRFGG